MLVGGTIATIVSIIMVIAISYLKRKGYALFAGILLCVYLLVGVIFGTAMGIMTFIAGDWKSAVFQFGTLSAVLTAVAMNEIFFRKGRGQIITVIYAILIVSFAFAAFAFLMNPDNMILGMSTALGGLALSITACADYMIRNAAKRV